MKKSQNIDYLTPLQANNINSKKSNAETCSTIASEKGSSEAEDDCLLSYQSSSVKESKEVMLEIEEILTKLNSTQIPAEFFREIHSHLKDK